LETFPFPFFFGVAVDSDGCSESPDRYAGDEKQGIIRDGLAFFDLLIAT